MEAVDLLLLFLILECISKQQHKMWLSHPQMET